MRLPGAALLIALGLILLWIATTGKIDRLAEAWDFIRNPNKNPLGKDVTAELTAAPPTTADRVASGVLHPETFHMGSMMETLRPLSMFSPGGMN